MGIISNGNTVIDNGAIDANEVDTTQIANDAVTTDKLADTAVTAGSYTAASITVDAQGRITAASSGAGAANMKYAFLNSGSSSGNITAGASVTKTQAFLWAGGGGGGGGQNGGHERGGPGGTGGFGYFTGPVSGPATIAYSIGAQGNGANSQSPGVGNSGGATNFHNFTVNGGGGGPRFPGYPQTSSPGTNGNAPGAESITASSATFFANADALRNGGTGGGTTGGTNGTPGALVVLFNDG